MPENLAQIEDRDSTAMPRQNPWPQRRRRRNREPLPLPQNLRHMRSINGQPDGLNPKRQKIHADPPYSDGPRIVASTLRVSQDGAREFPPFGVFFFLGPHRRCCYDAVHREQAIPLLHIERIEVAPRQIQLGHRQKLLNCAKLRM